MKIYSGWMHPGVASALLLVFGCAHAAPPQTVYRCGPDGRVYSQTPCADGKPVTIDDPRSASQTKAAREVAERDARQAQQLADERRRREAAAEGQGLGAIKLTPAEDAASKPAKKSRTKAPTGDPRMSPTMVAPAPAPAPK